MYGDKINNVYSFLWNRENEILHFNSKWHFNAVQEVISEPIVRGSKGIDIGSGCGYDTYIMAKENSSVKIVSIDLSDGVYETKRLTSKLKNVQIIKGSVLEIPIKDNNFDFAYSFGVLHHIRDIRKGLLEIYRILKNDSPIFLYLYEDHSENIIKYIAIKIISKLRKITVKVNPKIIYILSYFASPFIFFLFSLPAKIFARFSLTKHLYEKIPFNFGINPFSLRGDLYDRFCAPIEHRFSRQQAYDLLISCNFYKVYITRLKDSAGWVVWGYKNNAQK